MKDAKQVFADMFDVLSKYLDKNPQAEGQEELAKLGFMLKELFSSQEELDNGTVRSRALPVFQQWIFVLDGMDKRTDEQEEFLEKLRESYNRYIEKHDEVLADDALNDI